MFQTKRFLTSNFGDPPGLRAFLGAYSAPTPSTAAAEKWFQRASLPAEWLAVLLAYLEIDRGAPVSMIPFLEAAHG